MEPNLEQIHFVSLNFHNSEPNAGLKKNSLRVVKIYVNTQSGRWPCCFINWKKTSLPRWIIHDQKSEKPQLRWSISQLPVMTTRSLFQAKVPFRDFWSESRKKWSLFCPKIPFSGKKSLISKYDLRKKIIDRFHCFGHFQMHDFKKFRLRRA